MINKLCAHLGGINALSHKVGILKCYNTHEMTLDNWNQIISVNLTGTFNVNRQAIPHLLKNEASYLINNSSIAVELPHPWMAAYVATKGGMQAMTRSLALEYYLQGLRANCILPGSIDTGLSNTFEIPQNANPVLLKTLTPLGKASMVSPDKVAGTVAFLASDDAFHITGTEITVDGGKLGSAGE